MITPSSPITGTKDVVLTGFTGQTYTLSPDQNPALNGKQWMITAAGGTQAGVTTHSVSCPFTVSVFRPLSTKTLGSANPITGKIPAPGKNKYSVITRKGTIPYSGAVASVDVFKTEFSVTAGSETNDIANVKAGIAAHIQMLMDVADSLVSTVQTGSI